MLFRIFTLHPSIFQSFISNSLIARGVSKDVINFELVNWRENFGVGSYKQIDDKPFGGGSGMVLQPKPILEAMQSKNCIQSNLYRNIPDSGHHKSLIPNNSKFFEAVKNGTLNTKKVNIMMTPRGHSFNQEVAEWLAKDFEEINILCGRYEGFDARVNDYIDLELSIGNFVLNGGEVASMCLVEAISRLVPGFITKDTSVLHDSFSSQLNYYKEFDFDNRKKALTKSQKQQKLEIEEKQSKLLKLFDDRKWEKEILPYIEHPQYTRPETYNGVSVPQVLVSGDHTKIQQWRQRWW